MRRNGAILLGNGRILQSIDETKFCLLLVAFVFIVDVILFNTRTTDDVQSNNALI